MHFFRPPPKATGFWPKKPPNPPKRVNKGLKTADINQDEKITQNSPGPLDPKTSQKDSKMRSKRHQKDPKGCQNNAKMIPK